MPETSFVIDATTETFDRDVLARSHERPVLVDFWAPWCGPCRVLGPILERLAEELHPAFDLVKVNSDETPELSMRYGVRGIPNVQLFEDGEVVDQFVGALPEAQVRAFLRRWCPTESDQRVAEASRLLESGQVDAARTELEQALAADPGAHAARLALAKLALSAGDIARSRELIEQVPASSEESEAAQLLADAVRLVDQATALADRAEAERRANDDPADVEAQYALGGYAIADGRYREALSRFLAAARADPGWDEQAPRRAMLVVFQLVGVRDPLADEFRDQLSRVYY